jgi:hypothetical protein
MSKNTLDVSKVVFSLLVRIIVGIGINRTISMSNTIKMMASRKNRIENGIRAVLLGSKPHSKGDDFSRSVLDRAARILAAIRIIRGTNSAMVVDTVIRFIN